MNTELINKLRKGAMEYYLLEYREIMVQAADALQAAQAEIERLKAELGDLPEAQADMLRTIKELRARLAALEQQEPVATVKAKSDAYGGTFVHWTKLPVPGMALYAAPVATAQPVGLPSGPWSKEADMMEGWSAAQPSQARELPQQEIYDIAHRKATRYTATAPSTEVMYGFSEMHLLDFVAAINAKEQQT